MSTPDFTYSNNPLYYPYTPNDGSLISLTPNVSDDGTGGTDPSILTWSIPIIEVYDNTTSQYITSGVSININSTGVISFNRGSLPPDSYRLLVQADGYNTNTSTQYVHIYVRDYPSDLSYNQASFTGTINDLNALYSIIPTVNTGGSTKNANIFEISGNAGGFVIDSQRGCIFPDPFSTIVPGTYTLTIVYRSDYNVWSNRSNGYNTSTQFTINITSTTPPSPSGANAIITLPFIFDLSAQDITVFGEEVTITDASFNLTTQLSLSAFRNSLLYKDNESGDMDISFIAQTALQDEINLLNCTSATSASGRALTLAGLVIDYSQFSKGNPGSYPPNPSSLANHFLQYIASLLFGHPQAQAPIKNDTDILTDLSNDNLGQQFVTELGNSQAVRHSILEQLINSDVSSLRFDISDNQGSYLPYPFISGDKIVFRVKMQGNLNVDAASGLSGQSGVTSSVLSTLFSGITGVENVSGNMKIAERVWKVTATLQ